MRLPLPDWTHVAVVYESGWPTLYLNGVPVRTGLRGGKAVHPGCVLGGNSYGRYCGTLDDVRLYSGGVTPELIQTLAAATPSDYDGDGTPDRFDSDGDKNGLPDAWETAHGLNARNAADTDEDTDGDRLTNRHEYIAGTNPRDLGSVFEVSQARPDGQEFVLRFLGQTGRRYGVWRRSDLRVGV